MYLKSLELIGFKSFPVRTKLEFGKGMTAIVGPNGCGKSNISDAIRWVLGEQSAKLLRGSKMEDCIFSGTDTRKPLGMAEVSLTFADCESVIDTQFNELTVTRRVFRSGEGQYFINKTPCRLKDIQRLFMGTGIGASSYSLMEQGRIDLILSARPEDRRAVFEEASGITKYKSDKREALRKLDQTEANLVRLADIIKEVKRQIISLQRQAGKARRAQTLRQDLRRLDIFAARNRVEAMDADMKTLQAQSASNGKRLESAQREIFGLEAKSEELHSALSEAERGISEASLAEADLRSKLELTEQAIQTGRARIEELREITMRDSADAEKASAELEKQRALFENTSKAADNANANLDASENALALATAKLSEHEDVCEKNRRTIEDLYSNSLALESQAAKLQNKLHGIEAEDRGLAARRERIAAEYSNLSRVIKGYEKKIEEFSAVLSEMSSEANEAESKAAEAAADLADLSGSLRSAEQKRSEAAARAASALAQLEIIEAGSDENKGLPAGSAQLLDDANPMGIEKEKLLGALSERIETGQEYRTALEAALRLSLDALVVTNMADGIQLLRRIEPNVAGSVRLLALDAPATPAALQPEAGIPLLDQVSCPPELRPLLTRLLSNTRILKTLDELPTRIEKGWTFVTESGAVVRGEGSMEIYRRKSKADNPLALKHLSLEIKEEKERAEAQLEMSEREIEVLSASLAEAERSVAELRKAAAERKDALARKEGEFNGLKAQADRTRDNLETVAYEIQELEKQRGSDEIRAQIAAELENGRSKSAEIKDAIAELKAGLQDLEQQRRMLAAEQTEAHVRVARHKDAASNFDARKAQLSESIAGLEALIQDRNSRAQGYKADIEKYEKSVGTATALAPLLRAKIEENQAGFLAAKERSAGAEAEWQSAQDELRSKRSALDELREAQNEINGRLIELRMKRSAAIDRITSDYHIPADAIALEPEPEWPEGRPDIEIIENNIAELRARLEAMGPVYEGAIDECQELQERFDFLQSQQTDLVNSKQQLMDLIKKINQTTTEMFANTFSAINENFQSVFKQLFGGGSAKLMLADEEDLLESGIEIIARPPGKRLQSVSLLSGGERTLTAVALLFAIYLFKPSPFCVLDELDASLDETNIGRFIRMLQGFLEKSQFVIITHNRQTISAADVLYGITMEELGISKIVSMKFSDHAERAAEGESEKEPAPAPA